MHDISRTIADRYDYLIPVVVFYTSDDDNLLACKGLRAAHRCSLHTWNNCLT